MFAHSLQVFLYPGHFFLVAEYSDDVVACNDAQLGEERLDHLEVGIVYPIENHGVDIFQCNMLFNQCSVLLCFNRCKFT